MSKDWTQEKAIEVMEAEITALRAEVERLGKDYQTARDAHDKLLAENDRFKISLSDTVQQTQDQASEITALRAENESLKTAIQRQANAVRTLEYCKKAEINILRQTHQQAHVAAMTLDSEKNANAILTEENERLRAERDRQYDQNAEQTTRIARLRAEVERLRAALEWYASSEAWTVSEVEGPDGDYGKRARAALEEK